MKCPNCKLENPENARQCDCGHEFSIAYSGARRAPATDLVVANYLRTIDDSLRTIKWIAVVWAAGSVFAAIWWLIRVQVDFTEADSCQAQAMILTEPAVTREPIRRENLICILPVADTETDLMDGEIVEGELRCIEPCD